MWTRELIKTRAKDVLRFNYWKSFAVSMIILVMGLSFNKELMINIRELSQTYGDYLGRYGEKIDIILGNILVYFSSIWITILILRIVIGFAVEVGCVRYFIKAAEGETDMSNIGYFFKGDRYIGVTLTIILRNIYITLWTLLLIIPGIIKYYAYRMVPYILADNPNIGYRRAIQLSNEMTQGEKANIWILDLSFLGWYILGTLALLVGVLFVHPYEYATNAELYLVLRERAISQGLTSHEELNITQYKI